MGRDLARAISLLPNNVSLKNKKEILSFLNSNGIDADTSDQAYKVGLKGTTRLSFAVSIQDALQILLAIPHMTPSEAGDALISKGMNADAVHEALKGVDFDELDSINEKPDSLLSPYLQDSGLAFDQNNQKISEIDTDILSDLVGFIEKYPTADDSQIEKFLEAHGIDSSQSRAIIRMIHLAEDYPDQKTAAIGFEDTPNEKWYEPYDYSGWPAERDNWTDQERDDYVVDRMGNLLDVIQSQVNNGITVKNAALISRLANNWLDLTHSLRDRPRLQGLLGHSPVNISDEIIGGTANEDPERVLAAVNRANDALTTYFQTMKYLDDMGASHHPQRELTEQDIEQPRFSPDAELTSPGEIHQKYDVGKRNESGGLDWVTSRTGASAGFEPNLYPDGREVSIDDLAELLVRDQNMEPNNALNAMTTNGIPADEATRALRAVREESYEDKYDRPQGDLGGIMGQGETEEGPTEMPPVDSGGDPMPNNLGGEMGATGEDPEQGNSPTDSTIGMQQLKQETNPAEGDPIHDQVTREGEEDWAGMADGFLRENPQMSTNELGALLGQNGASQSTIRGIMRQFESGDSGEIRVGSSVSYKGKNFKVAGTTSTLYGDMIVLSNGDTVMTEDEDLGPAVLEKTASEDVTFEKLMNKTSKFFDKEYLYEEKDLTKMAKKANKLIDELSAYEPDKMSESVGIKEVIGRLRTAAAVFKEHAEYQSKENQEYLDAQPKYHMEVEAGYEFGPGGGDAIYITSAEMDQEHEELIESWPKTAGVVASQLVDENPEHLGSTGEMRRIASRYVDAKFAHMDGEIKDQVRTNFIGLVEKARRIALRDLPKKEARIDDELPHNYDEGVFF